jgi:phosphatidylglycerol lysyltransferase
VRCGKFEHIRHDRRGTPVAVLLGREESMMWRRVASLIGALLFGVSAWVLVREINQLGFANLTASLRSVPPTQLATAIAITVLNYLVLTWHDQLAFSYVGLRVPRLHISVASFVGYAVSNNVGFAMLSGTSARYRFYSRWGLTAANLSRIVLFYSTTFWLGLCVLGGSSLTLAPPIGFNDLLSDRVVFGIGCVAMTAVVAYVLVCLLRRRAVSIAGVQVELPRPRLLAAQLGVSTLDWLLAAAALFVLLPHPRPAFLTVAGAFTGAQLLGLVSHVPGGLGVFEGLMVLFLARDVSATQLLPALALYRVVYYLLPLGVALVVLLVDETRQRRGELTRLSSVCRRMAIWAAPRILAFFTFASGVVLLFSGATPSEQTRMSWLAHVMPLPLLEVSHFAASLTGLLLLLLAQAIARRVDAAFYVTAGALSVGSLTSLLKGGDYEEATVLAMVLVALLAARRHFRRRARIFENPMSGGWLAASATVVAASVWLGFFAYRHVAYSNELWWQFAFKADASRFLRASVAVTIAALAVGVRQLLRPVLPRPARLDAQTFRDVDAVIAQQPHTTPYLVYLGDKSLVWNASQSAFVMYAVQGRSCIALGDPVGPPHAAREVVASFLRMSDELGMTPVFYEASSDRLADYVDYGMTPAKIGELARVPLQTFSLIGSKYKPFRTSLHKLERENVTFRVVETRDVPPLLPELQDVSDEWLDLKGTPEKGFSLGWFDAEYMQRFPIALIEREHRIEAFANLWVGPGRVELSPDLMRYRATAPRGVMDALFAHMMLWGRDQGYQWFNLGMAPLSGLPDSPVQRAWSRVGKFVYRNGESFYNFQGLRAYKEKFDPIWEPRYLVYPGVFALPRVLADLTALIAGGYRQIFKRTGHRAA